MLKQDMKLCLRTTYKGMNSYSLLRIRTNPYYAYIPGNQSYFANFVNSAVFKPVATEMWTHWVSRATYRLFHDIFKIKCKHHVFLSLFFTLTGKLTFWFLFFALVFAYFRGMVSVLVCVGFDWNIMEQIHVRKCNQFLRVHWELE